MPATTGGRKRTKSEAGSEPSIPPALSGGNGWLMARTPREMDGESSFGGSTSTPARTNTTARGSLRKKEKDTKNQKGAAMPCPICLKYPQDLPVPWLHGDNQLIPLGLWNRGVLFSSS